MLRKTENIQTTRRINFEMINATPDLMMRVELSKDKIAEYAEAMKLGAEFPPLDCAEVDGELMLYDGFLRYAAYKKQRVTDVAVRIRVAASHDDAVLWAVQAGAYQDLKRTNADKQKAVKALLATDQYRNMTNVEIANAAGVDPSMVQKHRTKMRDDKVTVTLSPVKKPDPTRIDKLGRKRPTTYAPRVPRPTPKPEIKPITQPGSRHYTPPLQKMQWPTAEEIGKPSPELENKPHPDHPGMTYLQVFKRDNPGYVHAIPLERKRKEEAKITTHEIVGRVREIGALCKALLATVPGKVSAESFATNLDEIPSSALWKEKFELHRADIEAALPVIRELLDATRKNRK